MRFERTPVPFYKCAIFSSRKDSVWRQRLEVKDGDEQLGLGSSTSWSTINKNCTEDSLPQVWNVGTYFTNTIIHSLKTWEIAKVVVIAHKYDELRVITWSSRNDPGPKRHCQKLGNAIRHWSLTSSYTMHIHVCVYTLTLTSSLLLNKEHTLWNQEIQPHVTGHFQLGPSFYGTCNSRVVNSLS